MPNSPSCARSADGIVATSHPLAVDAGLRALSAGGSAADAAVAAAAVLTVVDPRSTGVGGDLFALYWSPGASGPTGLAAAGVSPAGLSVESVRSAGFGEMPADGPWSVTVPGAPAGWDVLLERFGKLDRHRVFEPAIRHAYDGFSVSRVVADEWVDGEAKLRRYADSAAAFLPLGRAPMGGEGFAVPSLGRTLRRFVDEGAEPFYRGELAQRIADAVERLGGPLRAADLAEWVGPSWVDPISVEYGGMDVFQIPPPGQGLVVLEALKLYEGLPHEDVVSAEHAAVEALKMAFADAADTIADPLTESVPVHDLLSDDRLARRRSDFRRDTAMHGDVGRPSDTVYVAVAHAEGGACSLIQSVYESFGSGIVVPETGIVLQNRASGFRLDAQHPNRAAPRKRPYHTIIPAMLGEAGRFRGCLGVVGGYMQPQGQLQVLRNMIDRGMDPQSAVDAPRFRAYKGRRLGLEPHYNDATAAGLAAKGHEVEPLLAKEAGGGQVIVQAGSDFLGGSDTRKDGHAAAVGT